MFPESQQEMVFFLSSGVSGPGKEVPGAGNFQNTLKVVQASASGASKELELESRWGLGRRWMFQEWGDVGGLFALSGPWVRQVPSPAEVTQCILSCPLPQSQGARKQGEGR